MSAAEVVEEAVDAKAVKTLGVEDVKDYMRKAEELKAKIRDDPVLAALYRKECLAQLSKTEAKQEKNAKDIKAFNLHVSNDPVFKETVNKSYLKDRSAPAAHTQIHYVWSM